MAQHAQLRTDTDPAIYFYDPQAPWQRGTNENTNGLLRQYFPNRTDLHKHTPTDLDDEFQGFSGHMRSGSGPGRAVGWFGCAR